MDKRISELDLVTTLTSNDVLPIVNGGVTKKVRVSQLGTDLTYTASTSNGVVVSSTGADATIPLASGSNAGLLSPTEKLKLIDLSGVNTGDQDLSGFVLKNSPITGKEKTKIKYDSKGLVIDGTDATTSDIADSTNKRYVTDDQLILLSNTSGTNSGDNAVNSLYSGLDSTKENKSLSAYSMRVNNTNATANSTEVSFQQSGMSVYTGSPNWTGGTAPSGATSHTYNWIKIGNLVTLNITLFYGTTGSGNSSVVLPFLSDFPTPIKPTALSGASNVLYNGVGEFRVSATSTAVANMTTVVLRSNSDNTGFEINVVQLLPTINAKITKLTIQYFTA